MTNDANVTEDAKERDPARVAETTIEPYPHTVLITAHGVVLAQTQNGLLLRETYAPDIYVPEDHMSLELLSLSETETYCPYKSGTAAHYHATVAGKTIKDVAWRYCHPLGLPTLKGHYAFEFNKVSIEIDGQRVRGHVRDPHKTITVAPVDGRLRMEIEGQTVVDTERGLLLKETGLPARYYIPSEDIDADYLVPSDRHSVCTYKGEATYHHLRAQGALIENVVWSYPEPWTDFSPDVGKIAGFQGVYASAFDRVFIGGDQLLDAASNAAGDRAMIATPTVDQVLRDKNTRAS